MNSAIILAGGKGTRLSDNNPPKALLSLHDKTLLEWQFEWLKTYVDTIVLALGHRADEIIDFIKKKNLDIKISVEDSPLGSGGAVKKAFLSHCSNAELVYILNVDDLARVNIIEAFKVGSPCIVGKSVPFSIIAAGKLHAQNETLQHIGHTVLGKKDILNLPAVGSYEKWLQDKNIKSFNYTDLWMTINSVEQLKEAEKLWNA